MELQPHSSCCHLDFIKLSLLETPGPLGVIHLISILKLAKLPDLTLLEFSHFAAEFQHYHLEQFMFCAKLEIGVVCLSQDSTLTQNTKTQVTLWLAGE